MSSGTDSKLASLTQFAEAQFAAYTAAGVGNPDLGPYEALGRGLALETNFTSKFGAQTESEFVAQSYKLVFGRDATAAQQAHFQGQIDYFQSIYATAKIDDATGTLYAKGAVLGQMIGTAVLEEPASHKYVAQANNFVKDASDGSVAYGLPLSAWDVV